MLVALALGLAAASLEVDRGDYLIHCEVIGTGKPMVAIAGGPGFDGRAVWAMGFDSRDVLRTYLFDQLGTGKSRMKDPKAEVQSKIDLFRTVDDLEAVRRAAGAKRWIVFGQSWGAIVALVYAARHPAAVEHLVLTSVPGLGGDASALSANLQHRVPPEVLKEIESFTFRSDVDEEAKTEFAVLSILPYYFHDPDQGKSVATRAPSGIFSPRVFLALSKHIANESAYRSDLAKLRSAKFPVTLIQGQQDRAERKWAIDSRKNICLEPGSKCRFWRGIFHGSSSATYSSSLFVNA